MAIQGIAGFAARLGFGARTTVSETATSSKTFKMGGRNVTHRMQVGQTQDLMLGRRAASLYAGYKIAEGAQQSVGNTRRNRGRQK